jgi:hypothetical protein
MKRIPVRGKHLDDLSPTDKLFIGISKAQTGPFVYFFLRYCFYEPNILWGLFYHLRLFLYHYALGLAHQGGLRLHSQTSSPPKSTQVSLDRSIVGCPLCLVVGLFGVVSLPSDSCQVLTASLPAHIHMIVYIYIHLVAPTMMPSMCIPWNSFWENTIISGPCSCVVDC